MCAIYEPPSLFNLTHFSSLRPTFEYLDEAYPGYWAPALVKMEDAEDELVPVKSVFGLIPYWSKDGKNYKQTYNARSETIAGKNSYRGPWKRRQFCLIPAQSFFEPRYAGSKSARWRIYRKDGQPFAIAGIWDRWNSPDGEVRSHSMVTVNAADHPLMKHFHKPTDEKRSVVVLDRKDYSAWLGAKEDGEARALLRLFNADEYTAEAAPKAKPPAMPPAGGAEPAPSLFD